MANETGQAVRRIPAIVPITLHAVVFAGAYLLAYLIRFDGVIPSATLELAKATLPLVVLLKLAVFLAMGKHRGSSWGATFADLISLIGATTLASVVLLVADAAYWTETQIPRSILVMDWAATLLVLGGIRASIRLAHERRAGLFTRPRPARADEFGH